MCVHRAVRHRCRHKHWVCCHHCLHHHPITASKGAQLGMPDHIPCHPILICLLGTTRPQLYSLWGEGKAFCWLLNETCFSKPVIEFYRMPCSKPERSDCGVKVTGVLLYHLCVVTEGRTKKYRWGAGSFWVRQKPCSYALPRTHSCGMERGGPAAPRFPRWQPLNCLGDMLFLNKEGEMQQTIRLCLCTNISSLKMAGMS